jgi:antiviral helicase SKI2
MEGFSFDDLESYFLNEKTEEWEDKPKPETNFDDIEAAIDDPIKYSLVFDRYFTEGKHSFLDLPIGSNYETELKFNDTNEIQDLSFKWNSIREYEKPYRNSDTIKNKHKLSDHIQPLPYSRPITEDQYEEILSAPIPLFVSDIQSGIQIMDSEDFNTSSSFLVFQDPEEEENKDLGGFVLPNLSADANNQYAIEDNIDVKNFDSVVPVPVIQYPFILDEFQKRAIIRLEQKQNVFIAAHTSAGKTVVAEYAIALARERMSRVIYTSPIKALSNQKYREFKDQFRDIGILTGDISIDEDAFCVIMTTEILRSMLYHNSSKLRDLEWVILDEVHYINDAERGVVWEEVLIMLPSHVRIVMLSATVPNYMEFSNWVGRVRNQKVYVQITYKRPVPLEHSVYVSGQFIKLVEADGTLNIENYNKAKKDLEKSIAEKGKVVANPKGQKQFKAKKFNKSEDQQYKELIVTLRNNELLPCVIFAFSRDKVDKRGEKLAAVNLLSDSEKYIVNQFADRCLRRLNPIDRNLPQILQVLRLLSSGIGIHHSGVLPILKEIVEILFSKGLIKVLVATETFAMGLNMPTKTVVFCELRKFDGNENRYLQPGEYTQMSGRAGRRGKDTKGTVIMFFKDPTKLPSTHNLQNIVQSKPFELASKFRIRYNQIVNVLNTEGMDINEIMRKSFMENQNFISKQSSSTKLLMLEKGMKENGLNFNDPVINNLKENCEDIRSLLDITTTIESLGRKPKLGSFLEISFEKYSNVPALLLNGAFLLFDDTKSLKLNNNFSYGNWEIRKDIIAKNVLWVYTDSVPTKKEKSIKDPKYLNPETVAALYQDFLSINKKEILTTEQTFKNKIPQPAFRSEIVQKLVNSDLLHHPDRHNIMKSLENFKALQNEYNKLLKDKNSTDLSTTSEMESRLKILKLYNCINDNLVVQLKGRVLGVFNNPYNLVITQTLFEGYITEMTPEEIAGLASIFVTEDKSKQEDLPPDLPDGLKAGIKKIRDLAESLKNLEINDQINSELNDQEIKLSMVEIVYLWAKGKPFVEICEKTTIKEGNIVRGILRVHDLLRNITEAGTIMGDHNLKKKSKQAADLIQRDIAFATSLYISN